MLDAGGAYLLLVTDNQPTLYNDIHLFCDPRPSLAALPLRAQREVQTHDRGPGRQHEGRHQMASTDLNDDAAWWGLA